MYTEETFIARLIGFELSEKEARLYFHLLKYGPKSTAPLTKSLKTDREDVHRTLSALIEKGMGTKVDAQERTSVAETT
jgi:predicted transcriptional regulator